MISRMTLFYHVFFFSFFRANSWLIMSGRLRSFRHLDMGQICPQWECSFKDWINRSHHFPKKKKLKFDDKWAKSMRRWFEFLTGSDSCQARVLLSLLTPSVHSIITAPLWSHSASLVVWVFFFFIFFNHLPWSRESRGGGATIIHGADSSAISQKEQRRGCGRVPENTHSLKVRKQRPPHSPADKRGRGKEERKKRRMKKKKRGF